MASVNCLQDFELTKVQQNVWNCNTRFIDILAGRRGGKDYVIIRKAIAAMYNDLDNLLRFKRGSGIEMAPPAMVGRKIVGKPWLHYWVVAPTQSLLEVAKREFFEAIRPECILLHREQKGQVWLSGFMLVEFKSADRPDLLVGSGLNGIVIDEYARLKPGVWMDNLRPTISDKMGWCYIATTGKGRRHHYYTDIRRYSEPGPLHDSEFTAFHWKTVDNTAIPGIVVEVEHARKTMPPGMFRRNYEASLEEFEGQVFEGMDRKLHFVERIPEGRTVDRIIAGMDWGFSHAGCLTFAAICNEEVYIVAAWHEARLKVKSNFVNGEYEEDCWISRYWEINNYLHDKYGVECETVYCDPSRPEFIEDLEDADIPAEAADNEVDPGIQDVALLLVPRIQGGPRMVWLTEGEYSKHVGTIYDECEGYSYKPNSEKVLKMQDEGPDTVRYLVRTGISNEQDPLIGAVA